MPHAPTKISMKVEDAIETVGGEVVGSGDVTDPKRWSDEEQLDESGEVKGTG